MSGRIAFDKGAEIHNIVFLGHSSGDAFGSTLARSVQMAELCNMTIQFSDKNAIYTTNPNIKNSLVIANKFFLAASGIDDLFRLRSDGNIIIADYIDAQPSMEQIVAMDGLMACARDQLAWYQKIAPGIPSFHVTQIVDPRFPDMVPPSDKLRMAYFGSAANALHENELRRRIDLIDTPTKDLRWMAQLGRYNCHYAVRRRQPWDGFKPFGKGFIAARYKCPVIASQVDGDATIYLSEDYPYLLKSDDLASVLDVLDRAASDFGGARWKFALEIMEQVRTRSTNDFIAKEFRELVDYFSKPNRHGHRSRVTNRDELASRHFRFCRANGPTISHDLVLNADGSIGGHHHPNENSWSIEDGMLSFRDTAGSATTVFSACKYNDGAYSFVGKFVARPGVWHTLIENPLANNQEANSAQ